MLMTEQLFDYIKKVNHAVEADEARKFLNLKQKSFLGFVKSRKNIFQYDLKCPYRECYPDAKKEQYMLKNKSEKTLSAVKLVDPNLDIFKLWHNECDDV